MDFHIKCSCGVWLLVNDGLAGQQVRCPNCRSVQFVPGGQPRPAADAALTVDLEELPPEPAPRSGPPPSPLLPPPLPPRRMDIEPHVPPLRLEEERPVERWVRRKSRQRSRPSKEERLSHGGGSRIDRELISSLCVMLIGGVWFFSCLAVGGFWLLPFILMLIGFANVVRSVTRGS